MHVCVWGGYIWKIITFLLLIEEVVIQTRRIKKKKKGQDQKLKLK